MLYREKINTLIGHFCSNYSLEGTELNDSDRCILLIKPENATEQVVIIDYNDATEQSYIAVILIGSRDIFKHKLLQLMAENHISPEGQGVFTYDELSEALMLKQNLPLADIDEAGFVETVAQIVTRGQQWREWLESATAKAETSTSSRPIDNRSISKFIE